MSKKFVPTESNIQELLKNLGTDQKPYPKELLNARRAAYVSQLTSVISSGPRFGNGQGQSSPPQSVAPMTPMMKAVLTALVVANVALATYLSVFVYENWDRVQELLFGVPSVSSTSPSPPEILTEAPELEPPLEVSVSPEEAVVPSETPEPTGLPENVQPLGGDSVDNPQVDPSNPELSTPEPGGDNSGLHLGQTPHGPDDPPGQDNNSSGQNDQKNNQGNQDKNKNK